MRWKVQTQNYPTHAKRWLHLSCSLLKVAINFVFFCFAIFGRDIYQTIVYYATLNQLSEAAMTDMDLIRSALESSGPGLSNAHRTKIVSVMLAPVMRYIPWN